MVAVSGVDRDNIHITLAASSGGGGGRKEQRERVGDGSSRRGSNPSSILLQSELGRGRSLGEEACVWMLRREERRRGEWKEEGVTRGMDWSIRIVAADFSLPGV